MRRSRSVAVAGARVGRRRCRRCLAGAATQPSRALLHDCESVRRRWWLAGVRPGARCCCRRPHPIGDDAGAGAGGVRLPRVRHRRRPGDARPVGLDLESLSSAFERLENEEDFKNAVSNPSTAGVNGDLIASSLQGDYLAVQERAFRARHSGRIRDATHSAGRRAGHGNDAGVFTGSVLNYIEGVLKASKNE